jgi:hypothetical protein
LLIPPYSSISFFYGFTADFSVNLAIFMPVMILIKPLFGNDYFLTKL